MRSQHQLRTDRTRYPMFDPRPCLFHVALDPGNGQNSNGSVPIGKNRLSDFSNHDSHHVISTTSWNEPLG